jgi:hypothetical protein
MASGMCRRSGLTAVDVQGGGGCSGASDSHQNGNYRSGKAPFRYSRTRALKKEDVRENNGKSERREENLRTEFF